MYTQTHTHTHMRMRERERCRRMCGREVQDLEVMKGGVSIE